MEIKISEEMIRARNTAEYMLSDMLADAKGNQAVINLTLMCLLEKLQRLSTTTQLRDRYNDLRGVMARHIETREAGE